MPRHNDAVGPPPSSSRRVLLTGSPAFPAAPEVQAATCHRRFRCRRLVAAGLRLRIDSMQVGCPHSHCCSLQCCHLCPRRHQSRHSIRCCLHCLRQHHFVHSIKKMAQRPVQTPLAMLPLRVHPWLPSEPVVVPVPDLRPNPLLRGQHGKWHRSSHCLSHPQWKAQLRRPPVPTRVLAWGATTVPQGPLAALQSATAQGENFEGVWRGERPCCAHPPGPQRLRHVRRCPSLRLQPQLWPRSPRRQRGLVHWHRCAGQAAPVAAVVAGPAQQAQRRRPQCQQPPPQHPPQHSCPTPLPAAAWFAARPCRRAWAAGHLAQLPRAAA
mmetsp:Transcript_76793/g.206962  ORF Transcript_76793/g.206962 Transcript_76793/m.206962 type:complete len:324 (-) Transcript_76793:192-1163(-)